MKEINSEGAQGTMYAAKDKFSGTNVLVKINEDKEINYKEHTILTALVG
jgi:hypothetical protein